MIRLIGAELSRLRARRMTLITGVFALAAVGLLLVLVNFQVSPPSAAAVAQNQQYYEQAVQDWEQHHQEYEQECLDAGQSAQDCAYPKPTPQDYALAPSTFAEVAPDVVTFSTYLTLFAGYLLGASLIGAEYGTGAIANWLTFVPQRWRVLGSKLIATGITAVVGTVVAMALTVGVAALLSALHGGEVEQVAKVCAIAGRGVVLALVGTLFGFCLALLTRHTVAALGVAMAVLVGSVVFRALSSGLAGFARLTPYVPSANLTAFLQHGTSYYVPVITVTAEGSSYDAVERHLSFTHSAIYWAVLLVVVLIATAAVFRRRDVT